MQPYQQRVADEKDELDEKLHALENFIDSPKFLELDRGERQRLTRQATLMAQYSDVLGERIDAF